MKVTNHEVAPSFGQDFLLMGVTIMVVTFPNWGEALL